MLHAARGYLAPRFAGRRSASRGPTPRRCRSRAGRTPSSAPRRFTGCSITRRFSQPLRGAQAGRPAGGAVRRRAQHPAAARPLRRCSDSRPSSRRISAGGMAPGSSPTPRRQHSVWAAGFVDVRTSLEASPSCQPDAATYREFVTNVDLPPSPRVLASRTLRDRFMDVITAQAATTIRRSSWITGV